MYKNRLSEQILMNPTEAFSQYGNAPMIPAYVFWIVGIIIFSGAILFTLKKYAQNKMELMADLARFKNFAIECSIDDQLWITLNHMVDELNLKDPLRILKNIEEYDNSTNAYLKSLLDKGLKAGDYEEVLLHLTKIRSRVAAKVKEQFKPINSTADLFSGLELQIEIQSGAYAGFYDTTIASASSNNLVVHCPNINGKKLFFEPGNQVHFTFSREDDAVYQFTTEVMGKYQGSLAAIVFKNTDKIITSHVRKYTRIAPNFLIKILGMAAPNGEIHHIESLKSEPTNIIDISGGGMQLKVNPGGKLINYLEKGKILAFSIYVPEIGPVEELKGRIVRTDNIKDKGYIVCSLEFYGINSNNRCRLLQGILVFLSNNK